MIRNTFSNLLRLYRTYASKNSLKRVYYVAVAFGILHIGAGYNLLKSMVPAMEAAAFLALTFVMFVLLVLIFSRILRILIVAMQDFYRIVESQVELYLSTLAPGNRKMILFITQGTIVIFPTFVVCCFFWQEAYQEAFLGYTNVVSLLKVLYNVICVYLKLGCLKFVSTICIVYDNIMFDLSEVYYDVMFELIDRYFDLLYFMMEKLDRGIYYMTLLCLICREILNFMLYIALIYLPAAAQLGYNILLYWMIVTFRYVLVDYNLFLDWIVVTYPYVSELFYKSIFFDIYVVLSATCVGLCEAKAELQRESLMAKQFVLEIDIGIGDIIKFRSSYLGLIDNIIDISIWRVVFILMEGIYSYVKEKLSSYYMRAKMAAYFKDQADKSGKLDFLNSKPDELSKLDLVKSNPDELSKLDLVKSNPDELSKLDLAKSNPNSSGKR